jgi:hypothetical protein
MKIRAIRDNGLSILFGALFLAAFIGQSLAGYAQEVDDLAQHGRDAPGFWSFVFSSSFVVDVAENWQSEFLQFSLFILATIWLVQRGSPESKRPGDEGLGSDEDQQVGSAAPDDAPAWAKARGFRRTVFSHSLLLAMGTIFVLSWFAQSLAGVVVFNDEAAEHGGAAVTWAQYLATSDFWNRTLQNWQSELLAVASMAILAIYLRQRGSSQSKPVGSAHTATGIEG